jgi:hypothetical protein
MVKAMRDSYKDTDMGRDIAEVNMFDKDSEEAKGSLFHFAMCLDDSGSMSGSPWASLMQSYHQFLESRREGQGVRDRVSVISFADTARIAFESKDILSIPRRKDIEFRYGPGTDFTRAIDTLLPVLSRGSGTPIVLFMSDGGASVPTSALHQLRAQYGPHGLQFHAIGFGGGRFDSLRQMVEIVHPGDVDHHFTTCASGLELERAFVKISREATVSERLMTQFASEVSKMVTNKVVIDYL